MRANLKDKAFTQNRKVNENLKNLFIFMIDLSLRSIDTALDYIEVVNAGDVSVPSDVHRGHLRPVYILDLLLLFTRFESFHVLASPDPEPVEHFRLFRKNT